MIKITEEINKGKKGLEQKFLLEKEKKDLE